MIQVRCSGCKSALRAGDALAGRTVTCPKCKGRVLVPAPDPGFEVIDDEAPSKPAPTAKRSAHPGFEVIDDDDDVPVTRKRRPDGEMPRRPQPSIQQEPDDETVAVRHGVKRRKKRRRRDS